MKLPEKIESWISDEEYLADEIGMSEASIRIYHDKVLKIQRHSEEAENEHRMMTWLNGKLPVPQAYAYEVLGGNAYLLMSKCHGIMSCESKYMENSITLTKLLSTGLQKLWSIDISDCPADSRLKNKLQQAQYNVENGLVDLDNVEPETFGENGFENPEKLLQWLYDNQPEEELVLSHGDFCLPNIFGIGTEVTGYIDLGKTGIADKWCDIAICYRSLSHNYSGKYGGRVYSGYDDMLLFQELDIEPDWNKIRYYILLDELF
ncbi:MAG: aminoglycoside 3'-phosphotransferase [Bacillus sp. (in: Bacteria)]|nr:aminoglycoside 3'-phosphotransferase [Bacillus sp. (in: firmicutes)]MCM1427293.1 aminoglycoside 3'-phosphotransferase [Eubacterium sp.]